MIVRMLGTLALLTSLVLIGCNGKSSTAEPDTAVIGGSTRPVDPETEAKAVLKATLDSWVFGDSLEQFEKEHPGLQFFDTSRITRKQLGRYEIGTVRREGRSFEFQVTLTFKEAGRDVSRSGSYLMMKDPDGWIITGGAN